MKRITLAALAGTALLVARPAIAQQNVDFSKVEIKTADLGTKTYMLEGQGGNIVVACGQDEVIQVDTEFAPLHDKIEAAIDQACGGKPIKYIVNTHFHGDHTGATESSRARTRPPSSLTTISRFALSTARSMDFRASTPSRLKKQGSRLRPTIPTTDRCSKWRAAPRSSDIRTARIRIPTRGFLPRRKCARDG